MEHDVSDVPATNFRERGLVRKVFDLLAELGIRRRAEAAVTVHQRVPVERGEVHVKRLDRDVHLEQRQLQEHVR